MPSRVGAPFWPLKKIRSRKEDRGQHSWVKVIYDMLILQNHIGCFNLVDQRKSQKFHRRRRHESL